MLSGALLALFVPGISLADIGPINQVPYAFNPDSSNAKAITGPIILSTDRITFTNGASAKLELEDGNYVGYWNVFDGERFQAQLFSVETDPGPLLEDNLLCSSGSPARFLVIARRKGPVTGDYLQVSVFSGSKPPLSGDDPNICGSFAYSTQWDSLPAGDGPYDGIPNEEEAGHAAQASPAPEPSANTGHWLSRTDINPIDDTKIVQAILPAISGRNQADKLIFFVARCLSGETEAYIDWQGFLGSDSSGMNSPSKILIMRVGEAPAQTMEWDLSNDRTAVFYPGDVIAYLKSLVGVSRLVFQIKPIGHNPTNVIFDPTGIEAKLGELADTCGWSFADP